jgi:hypothetical protein
MAAAAGWDWVAPAALATAAAVVAATACWLALCRLAAWRRRRTRVASGFSPPDPPKGTTHRPYVKKGGHGSAPGTRRAGAGSAKGTSSLQAQRGLAKKDEPKKGKSRNPKGAKPMGRPIRLLVTVLLLPLRGQPDSPQWGPAQDEWNAMHILGPPTADGEFREPPPPPGQPTAAQAAVHTFQVPGFFSAKVAWWENRWAWETHPHAHAHPVHAHPCQMGTCHAHCRRYGWTRRCGRRPQSSTPSSTSHACFTGTRWAWNGMWACDLWGAPCEWIVRFTPRPSSRDTHTVKVPGVRTGPRARLAYH